MNEWVDGDQIVVARMSADEDHKEVLNASPVEGNFKSLRVVSFEETHEENENERSGINLKVQEANERIQAMRQWRKELERSVCWQREEYWQVEKAMGRKRSGDVDREEGRGVQVKESTVGRKWNIER